MTIPGQGGPLLERRTQGHNDSQTRLILDMYPFNIGHVFRHSERVPDDLFR